MVMGNSKSWGVCVVTPISIEPAHFFTTFSSLTSKISPGLNERLVKTTPLLKSSVALEKSTLYISKKQKKTKQQNCTYLYDSYVYRGLCAVRPPMDTTACNPQFGWNTR